MLHKSENEQPAGSAAPISGPHICSQVGHDIVKIAKMMLMEACERSDGSLSSDEIENLLDLMGNVPEMFSIYRQAFGACAQIHKNTGFANFTDQKFAQFILKSYCYDVVRQVFAPQVTQSGTRWLVLFLDGLLDHIKTSIDPEFITNLFEHYRELAVRDGSKLSLSTFYDDFVMHQLVGELFDRLRGEHANHVMLEKAINKKLMTANLANSGSRALLEKDDLYKFFDHLDRESRTNPFRHAVNRRLAA